MSDTNRNNYEQLSALLTHPLMISLVSKARGGDRYDQDPDRRAEAWASWGLKSLVQIETGIRSYPAIILDGAFYRPQGRDDAATKPHIEIPAHALLRQDDEIAMRLGQAGNALSFAWFIASEVIAMKRVIFNHPEGQVSDFVYEVAKRRNQLILTLERLNKLAENYWAIVEEVLLSAPEDFIEIAAGSFSTRDVATLVPELEKFNIECVFESKLLDQDNMWVAKRIGVWQFRGIDANGKRFSIGALSPRLTRNSTLKDPHFAPGRESAVALLLRVLVMRRIVEDVFKLNANVEPISPDVVTGQDAVYLRAKMAKPGGEFPEAAKEGAAAFLNAFPDSSAAWVELASWAVQEGSGKIRETPYVLTVTEESFKSSFERVKKALHRVETPERRDIDAILPMVWSGSQVGRVICVRK